MDFDAGIAHRSDGDGQRDALQQREVHMDVEPLGLATGEAIGDDLKLLADGLEVVQTLLQTKIAQVVGAEFIAQEGAELFVLLEESVFPVSPVDVMAVFDLIDDGAQLTPELFGEPDAEDLADLVGGQTPQAELAASLEDLVNGEVAFEDEVAAVLDLVDGVEARQVHRATFLLGELGAENQSPVVQLFPDEFRTEAVGSGL